ncbi:IS110 family transposase [Pseudonocardia nigra]|uniref:IS110 family transposase n=1 Tax=Pseudonocardia nigra TaxID=1921578 RepID=UPI001C5E319F|nr:IS110 family transposase [Pseudonocardia nigra]
MSGAYEGKQIVGMDLHRRRSVLVRMTDTGEHLETVRISNDPDYLRQVMARAGESPEVVLEATYGWYWAADTLAELGAHVHLAHPLGVKMFSYRRVKNDELDAGDLADLLRMGRLPEAWIAPPATRELRGWVRHRAKLVGLRSNVKCQVHAVLAGAGVQVLMSDLFGPGGRGLLAATAMPVESRSRIDSLLRVIGALDFEIDTFARLVTGRLREDPGYAAIRQIPGVGPLLGAVFVAEIGDIHRFSRPQQLASWAGLTPTHRESDTTVHRGRITKQGSRLVRWAAVEAVQRVPSHTRLGQTRDRVGERRGRNIGVVAAARELITLVFYGLRDRHIRALAARTARPEVA